MSVQNLCAFLSNCNNHSVQINIIASIKIPHYIEKFEFLESRDVISFGEFECESFPFEIWKDTIKDVWFDLQDSQKVKFKVVDNDMCTFLEVIVTE